MKKEALATADPFSSKEWGRKMGGKLGGGNGLFFPSYATLTREDLVTMTHLEGGALGPCLAGHAVDGCGVRLWRRAHAARPLFTEMGRKLRL